MTPTAVATAFRAAADEAGETAVVESVVGAALGVTGASDPSDLSD